MSFNGYCGRSPDLIQQGGNDLVMIDLKPDTGFDGVAKEKYMMERLSQGTRCFNSQGYRTK